MGELKFRIRNKGSESDLIESFLDLRAVCQGKITGEFNQNEYGYLPQVAYQFPKLYLQLQDVCSSPLSFYPESLFKKNWHTSSGGERKKALIAKAMIEAKKVIILDEPFNHLDTKSIAQVIIELEKLALSGITVIYTGHEHLIPGSRDIEVEKWRS